MMVIHPKWKQPNINMYAVFIGQSALDKSASFMDFTPSMQFIIKSKASVDLSCRFQVSGEMRRYNTGQWL
jgi:hypothetical protein